jgi:prophage regulatory protein
MKLWILQKNLENFKALGDMPNILLSTTHRSSTKMPDTSDTKPEPASINAQINQQGYLRLDALVGDKGLFPISKSSWWAKVRTGEYPKPVKLGPRTTAWKIQDVIALMERFERGNS